MSKSAEDRAEESTAVTPFPDGNVLTMRQTYDPAMHITNEDDARHYFAALIAYAMHESGEDRETTERIQRANLGYYAGYYDNETRALVERLFHCAHPFFGAIAERGAPTMEEAFKMGKRIGTARRKSAEG